MELNMSKEEMRTKEHGMGEKGKMSYESKAEKEKTGKSGIKDPGHLQRAADYAQQCRVGNEPYIVPPEGPVKEPNLTNGVPMIKETNVK